MSPGPELYQDEAGEWRWRLKARNGEIIAEGGEGYTERNDAVEALDRVRITFIEMA